MTPLERAARAACEAAGYDWRTAHDRMMANPDDFPIDEDWMAAARAVLEAIREPSEAIRKALRDNIPITGHDWEYNDRLMHGGEVIDDEPGDCWRAMIDAALSEQGKP